MGDDVSLAEEIRRRYLTYAMSVVTSRALPDVRDGLKPVQRRILYAMLRDARLTPDARHRKSAAVVGAVLGKYHPHGDSSVYDAMVRLAQPWTMSLPLVDGQGNFGSLDGDSPAAMRYTECRLAPAAEALLGELDRGVVEMRPTYDGAAEEPTVLPARFPNLLVNGSTGIAVGVATSVPPHNLAEICQALVALLDDPDLSDADLLAIVPGPDLPTGGRLASPPDEIARAYLTGRGSIRVRAEYGCERRRDGWEVVVRSVPYPADKRRLVERLAEVVVGRELAALVDVRDESSDEVRVVLHLRTPDPHLAMEWLFDRTPLQSTLHVNAVCLAPEPRRTSLREMLAAFLEFRLDVVGRRLRHELAEVEGRTRVLAGVEAALADPGELQRVVSGSRGRAEAAAAVAARWSLDRDQTDAVLELRIYRLSEGEVAAVRAELRTLRRRGAALRTSLLDVPAVVRRETLEVAAELGVPRRTSLGPPPGAAPSDLDLAADELCAVVLTRGGWIRRVGDVSGSPRVREGDSVAVVHRGSTTDLLALLTSAGVAYVVRMSDVVQSTGHGEPVQRLLKFSDGETVLWSAVVREPVAVVAASSRGFAVAATVTPEATTRAGRRYARVADGDRVAGVCALGPGLVAALADGRVVQLDAPVESDRPRRGSRACPPGVVGVGLLPVVVETESGDLLQVDEPEDVGSRIARVR